jgi:hypothetical protein
MVFGCPTKVYSDFTTFHLHLRIFLKIRMSDHLKLTSNPISYSDGKDGKWLFSKRIPHQKFCFSHPSTSVISTAWQYQVAIWITKLLVVSLNLHFKILFTLMDIQKPIVLNQPSAIMKYLVRKRHFLLKENSHV